MIFYPYKKGLVWAVFHNGEDHEFKTFAEADTYSRKLTVKRMQPVLDVAQRTLSSDNT